MCVPKVESCERAIKPIQFSFGIMLYHIVRVISSGGAVTRHLHGRLLCGGYTGRENH